MKLTASKTRDYLLLFTLLLAAMLFRRYDAFSNPQLWAEDGKIFLQQCKQFGAASLFMPFAGYLHLVMRLVALLISIMHIDYFFIPHCYNLSAFFITLLVSVQLFKSATYMGLRHCALYALIFVFLPLGPELFMNLTNILWITSLYLIDFLFIGYKYYEQEKNKTLKLLVIFIISLTGPFSLILAPLVLVIIFLERRTLSLTRLLPMIVILVGGATQLWCLTHSAKGFKRASLNLPESHHLWKMFKYNISDLAFLRSGMLSGIPQPVVFIICLFLFALFLFIFYICYRRIIICRKYVLPLSALLFLGSFIYSFWPMESITLAFAVPRYYFITYTCLAWIIIIGLGQSLRLCHFAFYLAYFLLQSRSMRSTLPDYQWKKQVMEYYEGKRTVIDINPDGWTVTLPKRK